MYSIEKISSIEELMNYSMTWKELLSQSTIDNVFMTFEWVLTWVNVYIEQSGEDCDLFIVIASDENNKLVGIAPLYIKRIKLFNGIKINRLGILGDNEICGDYLGFILKRNREKEVTEAILNYLFEQPSWNVCELDNVQSNTFFLEALLSYFENRGKTIRIRNLAMCPYIKLPDSQDSLLNILGSKSRYTFNKKLAKINDKVEICDYTERFQSLEDAFHEFMKLHQQRFVQMGKKGSFASNLFEIFHLRVIKLFQENGWLRLNFLTYEGKIIGSLYGYSYNNKYYYYLMGLDLTSDEYKKYSPGSILLYKNMLNAINEGLQVFDFLRGAEQYKLVWAKEYNRILRIQFYPKNLKSLLPFAHSCVVDFLKIILR